MTAMSIQPSQRLLVAACAAWVFIATGVFTAAQTPASPSTAAPATALETRNVILITLDGARTQEIFGGLDDEIFRAVLAKEKKTPEQSDVYKRYAAATPEERRQKLMPFFWGTWMTQHGSIGGNRARNSTVQLTNTHRFSYPGYSEILTGEARDKAIDSNDKRRNPFPTVLDFLKERLSLQTPQVAAFTSWDVGPYISSAREGAIVANGGYQSFDHPDPVVKRLNAAQFEALTDWDSVRHDYFTFHFAMAHLATARPRVLYLMLGETDDWAHDGRYDRVLQTLALTDAWFKELWTWLQSQDDYRDKTTILITTDHGRGNTPGDWGTHGAKIEGAQYTWLAAIGPDFSQRGEWRDAPTVYTNQFAATMAAVLGVGDDFTKKNPGAGKPVEVLIKAATPPSR
jgi:hypothetical protein